MRRSKLFLAPILPAIVLVACSSSDDSSKGAPSNDADASTPVTAQAACEHEFRVRFERCNGGNIAPATMASARARYLESCVGALALPGSTRTADEVDACATALEAEECGVFPALLPACAPKAGTLATGAACNVDAQCQSGHCDVGSPLAKGNGCGVCVDAIPEGDTCSEDRLTCAIGTFCVGSPESPNTGRCKKVRLAGANEACNGFDIGCRSGLICASVNGAQASCIPAVAVGESCKDDAMCAKGAFCHLQTGKCTPLAKAGEACDSQTPCSDGLGCDRTTNKCAALTFAEPGESCGGSVACREGVCGQGTGAPTCPRIIEDGKGCLEGAHMTCQAPAACIGGACVMPTTATCQ